MKKWIIVVAILILIIVSIRFLRENGRYKESEIMIGNDSVHVYETFLKNNTCEWFQTVALYQEDASEFFVRYRCDGNGYYIEYDGSYIKLDKALELNIITVEEIKKSGIRVGERDIIGPK